MTHHPSLRPLLTALRAASVAIPAASLSTVALAQALEERPRVDASTFELPAQDVVASEAERGDGPVDGYVATRTQTGTKTDTPILQIPQSISVITAERMRDQGALTLQDALRYTAGVRGEAYGLDSRGDFALIRGTSPVLFLDGLQQSFGSYTNTRTDPFTLERIEVLKGPSSMLYGQSPVGGLVNQVSKRPREDQKTHLQLQYGKNDHKQIAVDTTGPLTEDNSLLYRVVAIAGESGSQVNYVDSERMVLMPSITWRPTDDIEWTLLANVQRDDSVPSSMFLPHRGTVLDAPYGQFDTDLFVGEPNYDEYDTEQLALTSQVSWRLDDVWTLRQNLRYQESEVSYQQIYGNFRPLALNADNRTLNRIYYGAKTEVDAWVADHNAQALFDTGPIQHTLLIGSDYQHADSRQKRAGGSATQLDLYDPVYGTFDPSIVTYTDQPDQTIAQQGLYVQDQLKYERWLLTLGMRKDWADNRTEGGTRQKDDAVTGRVGLTYLFDNGVAPYLSYSESFLPTIGLDADGESFKPREGEQWELGVKYQPVASQSIYTAAVFDLRELNRQMPDPIRPNNTVQTGEVRIRGLELEALTAITPMWDLIAAYTHLDTEVVKGSSAEEGARIASIPEHMASLWSQHRFSLFGVSGFEAGAGARYVGASWDGRDTLKTPSTTLFDAMLGYRYQDWAFRLNATNLEDETYYTTCLARGDCFVGNRRTVVGTVSYSF